MTRFREVNRGGWFVEKIALIVNIVVGPGSVRAVGAFHKYYDQLTTARASLWPYHNIAPIDETIEHDRVSRRII